MSKLWRKYRAAVLRNCLGPSHPEDNTVTYWRNYLFAQIMVYLVPLSLLSVVPGMLFSLYLGLNMLAFFDGLVFGLLVFLALVPGIGVMQRKLLLMACTYFVATYLFYYIGFKGPGLIFLYAACVFGLIIMPKRYAYLWSVLNVLMCAFFGIIMHLDWSPVQEVNDMSLVEWMAICVNVIFLSFISSALLPILFRGLSHSFERQKQLSEALLVEKQALQQALENIESQNKVLRELAWDQSHNFRGPLSRLLGLLYVLKRYETFKVVKLTREEIHDSMEQSATEIDEMVREINRKIESLHLQTESKPKNEE